MFWVIDFPTMNSHTCREWQATILSIQVNTEKGKAMTRHYSSGTLHKASLMKAMALVACLMAVCVLALTGCSSNSKAPAESSSGSSMSSSAQESSSSSAAAQTAESDYAVTIDSMTIGKDYNGEKAAIVTFTWTNNSDKATSFMVAVDAAAFQNGVELETAIVTGDGYDSSGLMKELKPGSTTTVQKAYALDDTSDVTVEVSELISLSDKIIATKTFPVA